MKICCIIQLSCGGVPIYASCETTSCLFFQTNYGWLYLWFFLVCCKPSKWEFIYTCILHKTLCEWGNNFQTKYCWFEIIYLGAIQIKHWQLFCWCFFFFFLFFFQYTSAIPTCRCELERLVSYLMSCQN